MLLVDVIERADDGNDVRDDDRPDQPAEEHAQVRDDVPGPPRARWSRRSRSGTTTHWVVANLFCNFCEK